MHWVKRLLKTGWVLILIIAPLLPVLIPQISQSPILAVVLTPAWIIWLLKLAYDYSDWFYFHVNRFWLWISNSEVSWTISLDLNVEADTHLLDEIQKKIIAAYPETKPWQNSPLERIYKLPFGCTARIKRTEVISNSNFEKDNILFFEVSELVVPFRHSEKTLERITTLISDSILASSPKPQDEKYVFKVRFKNMNPYFGLFVRRMRVTNQELVTFRCEFFETIGHRKERVDVSKERLALTTQSLNSMISLSKRYITLSSIDLSTPG